MVAALAFGTRSGDHCTAGCRTIPAQAVRLARHIEQEIFMQWTTPTACDLRFGFEITMYVSAR